MFSPSSSTCSRSVPAIRPILPLRPPVARPHRRAVLRPATCPAAREIVNFGHPQENQVLYAPTSREEREKLNLEELVKTIESLMQASKFDDAMIRWLQSDDHAEEI